MNKTPIQPYKSPPRTMSTVLEMGSQEKTHAPVAAYIAMTAGTNTVSWIIMEGLFRVRCEASNGCPSRRSSERPISGALSPKPSVCKFLLSKNYANNPWAGTSGLSIKP
jgi:hypothetical protein